MRDDVDVIHGVCDNDDIICIYIDDGVGVLSFHPGYRDVNVERENPW